MCSARIQGKTNLNKTTFKDLMQKKKEKKNITQHVYLMCLVFCVFFCSQQKKDATCIINISYIIIFSPVLYNVTCRTSCETRHFISHKDTLVSYITAPPVGENSELKQDYTFPFLKFCSQHSSIFLQMTDIKRLTHTPHTNTNKFQSVQIITE